MDFALISQSCVEQKLHVLELHEHYSCIIVCATNDFHSSSGKGDKI